MEFYLSSTKEFNARLDIEVLILQGVNDSTKDIESIQKAVDKIKPDFLLLNTLDRPGVLESIRGCSTAELELIKDKIKYENTLIIGKGIKRKNIKSYRADM